MKFNVGNADRIIRLLLGVVLIGLAYSGVITGTGAIVAYVVAAIAIVTGLAKFCLLYTLLGINTGKAK
jgi:hypothetical protein